MIKKTLITTAVSLTLMGATLVSMDSIARGPGGPGGHAARGGPPQAERLTLLERLDVDGDGVLSLEELSAGSSDKAERHFDRTDGDGDGLLSLEEFTAAGPRGHHPGIDELDPAAVEVCIEEILGYELPERPNSEAAFTMADTNLDASVDLDEFLAAGVLRAAERFAEIDADGDSAITSEEMEAFRVEQEKRRDAHHTCVTEQLDASDILN